MATETGSLGESTKLKVLSAGIGSVPARTNPRTLGLGNVNGANETELDACAATVACLGLNLVAVDRRA